MEDASTLDPRFMETLDLDAVENHAVRSKLLTVVTDSELQTFRSCHQLHDFKYRQRLRPNVSAKALAVGSIFHVGMRDGIRAGWDVVGRAMTDLDLRVNRQIVAAVHSIDARVGEWAATIVANTASVDYEALAAEVDETAALVKWMLQHYFDVTRRDLTSLELVETEGAFRVPMNDRRGRPVAHMIYEGVRDAVFYDPTYNAVVLYEHKTTKGDPRVIEKRVEMDTQAAGYLHALREVHRHGAGLKMANGADVPRDASLGRVVYNALRKSLPKPPKVNKNGQVSVAECVTTLEMYEQALHEQETTRNIPRTPAQSEFFKALGDQKERYFARVEWNRTRPEIERWRLDTFATARAIRAADRDPSLRDRNPGHCNMPWSLPCSYRSICLDPNAPELRKQFHVEDDAHTEVREAEKEIQ